MLNTLKSLSISGVSLKQLSVNNVLAWKEPASFKNLVPLSVDANDNPYNGGLGYKNGYRVRSGGAEGEASTQVCTGFIPCKAGQTLYIYFPEPENGTSSVTSVNVTDGSKTNLGQLAYNGVYGIFQYSGAPTWNDYVTETNRVHKFTIPTNLADSSKIAFVRVTIQFQYTALTTGEGLVVTVDEEITL